MPRKPKRLAPRPPAPEVPQASDLAEGRVPPRPQPDADTLPRCATCGTDISAACVRYGPYYPPRCLQCPPPTISRNILFEPPPHEQTIWPTTREWDEYDPGRAWQELCRRLNNP